MPASDRRSRRRNPSFEEFLPQRPGLAVSKNGSEYPKSITTTRFGSRGCGRGSGKQVRSEALKPRAQGSTPCVAHEAQRFPEFMIPGAAHTGVGSSFHGGRRLFKFKRNLIRLRFVNYSP